MRRKPFPSEQHSLSFARRDIWQSIPHEHQQQCRELCEQMLRALIQIEQQPTHEADHERQVPPPSS